MSEMCIRPPCMESRRISSERVLLRVLTTYQDLNTTYTFTVEIYTYTIT